MICVIGDFITDIYVHGRIDRISPESPIPVFVKEYEESRPGGAGNVLANLRALGSEVISYGFDQNNSTKYRYVSDNHILFRMDDEHYEPFENEIDFNLDSVNVCVLSDYNKGFLHNSQAIIDYCKQKDCVVIVDPKKRIENYKNADIVKLNHKELEAYCAPYSSIQDILIDNNISVLIVTGGAGGVYINTMFEYRHISAPEHQVADVTGAGDVFIAALAHFINKGLTIENACKKATILASTSVTKFGTYVLTSEDIKKAITVFTNGCFDILHRGHIEYLKASKALGSKLIVGLNSDRSVAALKGEGRPINNQQDRKAVLEALDFVDEVIVFDEDTPYELISKISPDIITKGGDYKIEDVVGNNLAEVVIIPFVDGYSTTNIMEKINV